jgi:hypothetical protein
LATRLVDILNQVTVFSKYAVIRLEFRRFLAERTGLEASLLEVLRRMSFMYFPLFVGAAAVMPALFRAWLDPRWFGGIVPAQLMMLTGLPSVSLFAIGAMLIALNFQRSEAFLAIAETFSTIAFIFAAAPFGLLASAEAYSLRPLVMLPLTTHLAKRRCGIGTRRILSVQLPALLAALGMGESVWLLGRFMQGRSGPAVVLVAQIAAGLLSYALFSCLLMPAISRVVAHEWLGRLRILRSH